MLRFIGGLKVIAVLALEQSYVLCLENGDAYMLGYDEEIDLIKSS